VFRVQDPGGKRRTGVHLLGAALVLVLPAVLLPACGGGGEVEAAPTGTVGAGGAQGTTTGAELDSSVRVTLEPNKTLGTGSKGEAVRELQQALAVLGFNPGPVDGFFGPSTRKAVIEFQEANDLVADGIVGQKTAEAMNRELESRESGSAG
jgi:hypothetical protein